MATLPVTIDAPSTVGCKPFGLVASSHGVYRKPMLRHRPSNLPFVPMHPTLMSILKHQPIGIAPVTQLAVLWNGVAVDGSAVLLVTPTALYRIPCGAGAAAAGDSNKTPASQPNQPQHQPLTAADDGLLDAEGDHVSCIPLDLVAFVHRQPIPYLSAAFEAVRFVSKPFPNSTELAFEAHSGGGNASVAIAASLRSTDVVDIKRVLQAVAPTVGWMEPSTKDTIDSSNAPQRTNPVTVVYPLTTFADVALRGAVDGRLDTAYDRLKLMADTFNVAVDEVEAGTGATDTMPLVGCSTAHFMSCVSAAKARHSPAANAVPEWAREKERLLAQMRSMDEELEYLRTQVELLSRHATIPPAADGPPNTLSSAVQRELDRLSGPLSAKQAVVTLCNDNDDQRRRHESALQELRHAMAVATHGLPTPLLLKQQLQGIQRLVLQLDSHHMRLQPTTSGRSQHAQPSAEVTQLLNELSTCAQKMLCVPAITKSDPSGDGAHTAASRSAAQNHKATHRALEDSVKLLEQHRQAEVELSASVDALRLRLIGSQCDASIRTRCFLRWYAAATTLGGRRGSRAQLSANELQKQLNDTAAAKQRVETTSAMEISSLRTRVAQLEEERHATAAVASTERNKLVHALEDERDALQTRCTTIELRRVALSEQNAALEASLLDLKRRNETLEGQLSASDKQRVAASEATRLAMEEQHEQQLNLVRASLREAQSKLREAESSAKADAHRYEEELAAERTEHAARKQAEIANVRAAMEEELDAFNQRALAAQRQRDAALAQIASLQADKLDLQAQLSETRTNAVAREKEMRTHHETELAELTRQWMSEVQALRTEEQRIRSASEASQTVASDALRNARDAAQQQAAADEKRVATLRTELDDARRSIKAMERQQKDAHDEKASLEDEHRHTVERLEAARQELQETREQCFELQRRLDETTLALDAANRQIESSKHSNALAVSEHHDALLRQVSELQGQLQSLRRERDGLIVVQTDGVNECSRLRDEIRRATADAAHQKNEASAALEMMRDVEEELQTIHHARTQLLTTLAETEEQHAEETARLTAQLRSLQEEHRHSASERAQLIAQHEAVAAAAAGKHEQFVRSSEERIGALEAELQARDTRLHDGLLECQSLGHQLRDALESLKASQAKETQLRRAMARREEEWDEQFVELKATAATQELSFSALTEQLKGQEANLAAVTASRDTLRTQLSRMEDDNHRLQRLTESLKLGGSQREAELMKAMEADRARLKTLHDHELRDAQDEMAKVVHQLEAANSRAAHAAHEAKAKQDGLAKQLQKLAAEVAEAKTHQKHAQAESLAQSDMLKDMERELSVVHGHLRDTSAELQAAEESVFRLEQERESWAQQMQKLHSEAQRSEAGSKEALQGLQTALLTLSHESEMKERELTSALERMSCRESAERSAERKQFESRIAMLQEEATNLLQERNELAARSSAMARRAKDAQDEHNNTMDEQRAAEAQLKAEVQQSLMQKLEQAMRLASELERELSMQFKKEQALTKALEDSAKRVVELNEENRSMLILLEKTKQDNAALLLSSDSALSNVRGERSKLLSVHEEELRLERDRVRRLEHERDAWSSERLELQRDYEGKLERSFALEKSRVAELTASWEVEREKIAKDHMAQLEILRKACQTTERRAEGLLSDVQHHQDLLAARDARIVELQEELHQAAVHAQEQAAAAAYKLSAALEMLSDVEVEASVHERSVVSSAEEVATLQNHLASLADVERKLVEARTEGQQHLATQFRLEEALSDSTNLVSRLQRDVANLTEDLTAAKKAFHESQLVAQTRSDQFAVQAANVSALTDANAKLSLEISNMVAKRTESEAHWDSKVAALAAERERMRSAHEQQVAVLHDERQRDASRTVTIQDENAALVKQLTTDQNIIAALRSELDGAEREMVKLHHQMQLQERELHGAQEELAKIDFLPRGALSNRPTAADTVKLLADDLRQVLDEKKRAMEREELLLRQLRDTQSAQQSSNDQSIKMCLDVIAGLETDLTELQQERDRLQGCLADATAEVAALQANRDALEQDLVAHKGHVSELQDLNAELEEEAEAAIVESQHLACKIDELDAAMARFSKEKQEIKDAAEKSTRSVLRTLEGQVENIIQGVHGTEERHQEEILEMQHQLECAEAVFQGLNLSLVDKSTRLEVATGQLRSLKEEHLGELKRVRERYAVSLREQLDAASQTTPTEQPHHTPTEPQPNRNQRAASLTSGPSAVASTSRSIASPRALHVAAPQIDGQHPNDEASKPPQRDDDDVHPVDGASTATTATLHQLSEAAAVERMNAQLAKDEVDVLTAQLESARLDLGAALERHAKTSSEVTILKLNLEEENYERELLQRRLSRLTQEHEQELAALTALHEDRTTKAVAQGDEQVKRLLARLVQADEALQSALSDKTQCKDTLKVVLAETANAVAMVKDTELAGRSREADLELQIHQLQSHLSAKETENEVQQSVVAHLRVSHDAEVADVHARLKHMSEALQIAHQEITTTNHKLAAADRTIEKTLHELQVLTQEHDDVVLARETLEGQLRASEAAVDELKHALADEQRLAHQTTEDRNRLYTIVTEAAQSAGMIAEERDALAAKLDACLCRPTTTTGTQCIDAYRTSQSTQYDVQLMCHAAVECVPVQATTSAATDVVAVRDVGTEAGHGLGGKGGGGPSQGASWTTTGMNTDETHIRRASAGTQAAAVLEHRAVGSQPIEVASATTSTPPLPRLRDALVGTVSLDPLSSSGHHKAVQTGWHEYLSASATQTTSSETLHSGAQCDSPVLSPRGSQTVPVTLCDATTAPLSDVWKREERAPLLASCTQTTSSETLHSGAQCDSPVMTPCGSQTDRREDTVEGDVGFGAQQQRHAAVRATLSAPQPMESRSIQPHASGAAPHRHPLANNSGAAPSASPQPAQGHVPLPPPSAAIATPRSAALPPPLPASLPPPSASQPHQNRTATEEGVGTAPATEAERSSTVATQEGVGVHVHTLGDAVRGPAPPAGAVDTGTTTAQHYEDQAVTTSMQTSLRDEAADATATTAQLSRQPDDVHHLHLQVTHAAINVSDVGGDEEAPSSTAVHRQEGGARTLPNPMQQHRVERELPAGTTQERPSLAAQRNGVEGGVRTETARRSPPAEGHPPSDNITVTVPPPPHDDGKGHRNVEQVQPPQPVSKQAVWANGPGADEATPVAQRTVPPVALKVTPPSDAFGTRAQTSPRTPGATRTKSPRTPRVASELERLRREADIDEILTEEQFARTSIFADEIGRRKALAMVPRSLAAQVPPADSGGAPGLAVALRGNRLQPAVVVGQPQRRHVTTEDITTPMAVADAASTHIAPSGDSASAAAHNPPHRSIEPSLQRRPAADDDAPPTAAPTAASLAGEPVGPSVASSGERAVLVTPSASPSTADAIESQQHPLQPPKGPSESTTPSGSARRNRGMSPASRAAKSQVQQLMMERDASALQHDEVFQRALTIADEADARNAMAATRSRALPPVGVAARLPSGPSLHIHPAMEEAEEAASSPLTGAVSPIAMPNEQRLSEPLQWSDSDAGDDGGDATQFFEEDSPAQRPQDAIDAMLHETLAEGDTSLLLQDEAPLPPAASNGPSHFFLDGHTTPTRFPGMSSSYSMATSPPPASPVGAPYGGHPVVPPPTAAHSDATDMEPTLDDYELCVAFADGMEVIEEDEFLDWTDLTQLHETEVYHALEREELRRVEGEQMRRFVRNDDAPNIPTEQQWASQPLHPSVHHGYLHPQGMDAEERSEDAGDAADDGCYYDDDADGGDAHRRDDEDATCYHPMGPPNAAPTSRQQTAAALSTRGTAAPNTGKDVHRPPAAAPTLHPLQQQQRTAAAAMQQKLPETSRHHRRLEAAQPTRVAVPATMGRPMQATPADVPHAATMQTPHADVPSPARTHASALASGPQQAAYVPATSPSGGVSTRTTTPTAPRSAASVFAAARGRQTGTGNGGTTPSKMSPYFIAGKNALVLQHTPPPIRKAIGGKLSSSHVADVLAAMTSEGEEAQETASRVQSIAALMARTRRSGGK